MRLIFFCFISGSVSRPLSVHVPAQVGVVQFDRIVLRALQLGMERFMLRTIGSRACV